MGRILRERRFGHAAEPVDLYGLVRADLALSTPHKTGCPHSCTAKDEMVPEEIARALDASAEDLKHRRIVNLDDSVREMQAELEAHVAQKKASFR
jgi:hypothetical protein